MRDIYQNFRDSYSVRAGVVGFLILILLIPLAMVMDVVNDRRNTSQQARHEIMRSWGQPQSFAGPVLVLPYRLVSVSQYGERLESTGAVRLLPRSLDVDVELEPDMLHRGIYDIPVYTARLTIDGTFAPPDVIGLGIDSATIEWERAFVALGVTDAKAIRNTPVFDANGSSTRFESGGQQIAYLPPQIMAEVGAYADVDARDIPLPFTIELDVSGTDSLQFMPMGDSTRIAMRSSWASPSFIGAHLPEERDVTDDGFTASWRISNLGRTLPSRWILDSPQILNTGLNYFGVSLYLPVDLYHTAERAAKYGVLFIGLTFVCYFLFEVIAGLRLHPLQYLLVGFANTLFYLLLLSFAEHVGFGWAYLLSAIASAGLITGYSVSILGERSRALLMFAVLALLYALLYLTLKAESYAMLAGSIVLWAALGLIMYLTRGIDWYRRVDQGAD